MPTWAEDGGWGGIGSRKAKGDRKEMRRARRDARRPPERAPAPLPTEAELAAVNARPVDTRRTWVRFGFFLSLCDRLLNEGLAFPPPCYCKLTSAFLRWSCWFKQIFLCQRR